jgi:predicted ATPase/DNA-binding SARP family transcriptional activator
MVELRVLGPIEAVKDGVQLGALAPRQHRLLAALVGAGRRVVLTDALAEALWGDDLPANPSAAVQSLVSRLRRALRDADAVLTAGGGYRLGDAVVLDSEGFEAAVAGAEQVGDDPAAALDLLDGALASWRGAPLEPDGDRFASAAMIAGWNARRVDAELLRARLLLRIGRSGEAARQADATSAREPYMEQPVTLAMTALAADGRHAEALRTYEAFRVRLAEIGLVPSPSLIAKSGDIAAHEPAPLEAPRRNPPRPVSLLVPPTTFVGRGDDLALLDDLVVAGRVVTVVGPGGVGKTRTALEWLERAVGRFRDGAMVCDLVPTPSPAGVTAVLTDQLGVQSREGVTDTERLAEFLANQQAVLLLDNCEHVSDGLAEPIQVLLAAASVAVLATSREPLGLVGEQLLPLAPLDGAGGGPAGEPAAVALFLDRARLAAPRFAPDERERLVVADICAALGHLPLAIELAAARMALRTVDELAAELQAGIGPTAVDRARPARHRSLRAAVEWSYTLLPGELAGLLDDASVFVGGWEAEAMGAVLGTASAAGVDELARRNLVATRHTGGRRRYFLLEPIRQVAAARLAEQGRAAAVATRHARWFGSFASRVAEGLRSAEPQPWVDAVEAEIANLRRAFEFLLDADPPAARQLVGALFWSTLFGMRPEVAAWADQAVADVAPSAPGFVMAASTAAAGAWRRGDLPRAAALADAAVGGAGTDPSSAYALEVRGDTRMFLGDFLAAAADYREAGRRAAAAGDEMLLAVSSADQAMTQAHLGNEDEAVRLCEQSAAVAARLGNPMALAFARYAAGEVRLEPAPGEAIAALRAAADLAATARSPFIWGVATLSAVSAAARIGDVEAAIAEYPTLLNHWLRQGAWNQQWTTLRTLVGALAATGRAHDATVLLAASAASTTAPALAGEEARRIEVVTGELRAELGAAAFAAAWAQGSVLDDIGALAHAHEVLREIG